MSNICYYCGQAALCKCGTATYHPPVQCDHQWLLIHEISKTVHDKHMVYQCGRCKEITGGLDES